MVRFIYSTRSKSARWLHGTFGGGGGAGEEGESMSALVGAVVVLYGSTGVGGAVNEESNSGEIMLRYFLEKRQEF